MVGPTDQNRSIRETGLDFPDTSENPVICANPRPLLLFALFICSPVDGAIYRCVEDSGVVLFSQFPCANAELISEPQVSVVAAPEPGEPERLMLKKIQQNSMALVRASNKRAKQKHRQRKQQQTNKTALCRQALLGIADLRKRKRLGYSLSESTALDKRKDELRLQQTHNC